MKLLGEELTSWNRYFIVNNFARPVHRNYSVAVNPSKKFTLLSNCAYYPGAKPAKKHVLNNQRALNSELRLLTRVYDIVILGEKSMSWSSST